MKRLLVVLAVVGVSLSAASLRADLLGTKVSGSLTFNDDPTNFFDPINGQVPAGYGNSSGPNNVTIGKGVEFGYKDPFNRDTANFRASTLTIRDVCRVFDGICFGSDSFQMKFADAAFTSARLLNNELGVNFSFSGDVLTINFEGGEIPDNNATAKFLIGSSAVAQTPELGTMGLVATGILGAAGAIRRRLAA